MYSIQTICETINGRFLQQENNDAITYLVYDSRRVQLAAESLFFALATAGGDGHKFLTQAHKQGIRHFVVQQEVAVDTLPDSNVILVPNTLQALQQLACFHRQHFQIPILGITGSNGKTVVKEWLYQLLCDDYNIVRSPKSFNSQIGVPLSVWQLSEQHTLGIFEAGISQPGEMEKLERIIQPTIGVLTNIGTAHDEGFSSHQEKLQEKVKLFAQANVVIGNHEWLHGNIPPEKLFSWSKTSNTTVQVISTDTTKRGATISIVHAGKLFQIPIPFSDKASIENAITCACVLLYLNIDLEKKARAFSNLHAVDMRLQLTRGINNCTLINDSYSADLTSLHIALSFLRQQSTAQKRTVILSDFFESGRSDDALYQRIATLMQQYKIEKVVGIGEKIGMLLQPLPDTIEVLTYTSTESFIQQFRSSLFSNEIILIKGARVFHFERLVPLLEYKVHQTQLEIDLNAIGHNLKQYQTFLAPHVKVMAMVKAFAYGSGGAEIASVLQFHNVDYLGVAYADEGVELRKAGLTVPVMVLNVDEGSFAALLEYNLQPVLFSFQILQQFEAYLNAQAIQLWPVHLEMETGMNRLGFAVDDSQKLGAHVAASPLLKIESVFTHLAASEDPAQDNFTQAQLQLFQKAISVLEQEVPYFFLKHISNSAAIVRHPQLQLDLVRLGIGLYGVGEKALELQPAATLRSTIAQIKFLKPGETVSYNRRGEVTRDSVIATVRIGYADGYSRRFSNGVGKMWVHGQLAPVIGVVCMDMTMIDVTDIADVKEGDEVILFGASLPVPEVAKWIGTIPYEIMTSISQRVKRIYFQE